MNCCYEQLQYEMMTEKSEARRNPQTASVADVFDFNNSRSVNRPGCLYLFHSFSGYFFLLLKREGRDPLDPGEYEKERFYSTSVRC